MIVDDDDDVEKNVLLYAFLGGCLRIIPSPRELWCWVFITFGSRQRGLLWGIWTQICLCF